ncbi:MAG: hypothetical protein NTV01_20610 [Bacteroidia bacterium]|nr:hypothetical protein [Bacteroidia bacterium]
MKTKMIIKVISSSGEPYDVHFEFSDNKFTAFCNCQAGIFGKLCKHKTSLLAGDQSLLFDKTDEEKLELLREVVKKSKYAEIISSYKIIKQEIEEAQKKEKKAREQIEHALKSGIEIVQ